MSLQPLKQAEILVVDDTPPNVQLLSSLLRNQGYVVRQAHDGISALEALDHHTPDMVLLDVRMPGMDGYEVCRRMKADPRLSAIPVIFVSAMDDQTDKLQGFAVGGVDYITKPFQMKEVLARVQNHLTITSLQRQLAEQNANLHQEVERRRQIEQALQQANEALEQRVAERTAELTMANQELNSELINRKRIESQMEDLLGRVRSQAQQVREIVNTVPEGLLLLSANTFVVLANPMAHEALDKLAPDWQTNKLTTLGDQPLSQLLTPPPEGLWHTVTSGGRTYEITSRAMPAENGENHYVLVLHDATQEIEIQHRLQQQDRLAVVGQMAAGIAHDFNNILAVITLYTDLAMNAPDLPARLRERLNTISLQSHRASELVTQILDFSRRTTLEPQPMDLLPFIKEQVKMLARTLPENIEISLEANEIATVVEADPTRLQQALFNLSMNARDAMPEGGKLGIRVIAIPKDQAIPCVTCGQVTGGQWICIEVEDSGTGISPATLPHIFEPFFTTKPPGQGTGLGLAQVFGIAKSHNGHIYVRSEAGQGSTFGLYLPAIKHERRSELSTPSSQLPQGMGQSLVVVEDEEVMRAALVDTLTLIHYKVIAFPNGEQTLAYLRQHEAEVDLILSDVVMPEMGGIQLMRTIRKRGWTMPFILMTGHAMEDELERLRDEGLTDYILKPPRVQDLARIISNAMKKDAAQ